ncbi:uncharacterized protein [Littorina saxatilis]|uniref:uncharacterized protein n=1 Tax=Littorina saxatilis TaxID=31220 RepID=UPI0038B60892
MLINATRANALGLMFAVFGHINCTQRNESAVCELRLVQSGMPGCNDGESEVKNGRGWMLCSGVFGRSPVVWEVVYPDHGQNKTFLLARCPAMTEATARPCVQNVLHGLFKAIRRSASATTVAINVTAIADGVDYIRGLTIRCRHGSISMDCKLRYVSPNNATITHDVVINKANNVFTCEGLRLVDTVTWELLEYDRGETGQDLGVCPPPYAGNCTQPLAPLFRTHRSWENATISTITLDGSDPKERARLQEATIVCRTPQSFASQRAFVGVDLVESRETLDKAGAVLGHSETRTTAM